MSSKKEEPSGSEDQKNMSPKESKSKYDIDCECYIDHAQSTINQFKWFSNTGAK